MKRRPPFRRGKFRQRGSTPPGTMNKTESAYAAHLDLLIAAGQVAAWRYESIKLRLADNTWLTPDFTVQLPDGTMEIHEVKACKASGGYLITDDAAVKIKVAAELYPEYRFLLCGRLPRGHCAGWRIEEVPCR